MRSSETVLCQSPRPSAQLTAASLPHHLPSPAPAPPSPTQLALNAGQHVVAVSAVNALHLLDISNPAAPGACVRAGTLHASLGGSLFRLRQQRWWGGGPLHRRRPTYACCSALHCRSCLPPQSSARPWWRPGPTARRARRTTTCAGPRGWGCCTRRARTRGLTCTHCSRGEGRRMMGALQGRVPRCEWRARSPPFARPDRIKDALRRPAM